MKSPGDMENRSPAPLGPIPPYSELGGVHPALMNNATTACKSCCRPLSDEQIKINAQCQQADRNNVRTIMLLFALPLLASVLLLLSMDTIGSWLGIQGLWLLFLLFIILSMFLAISILWGKWSIKNVGGSSYYCPECLEMIGASQQQRLGENRRSRIISPGQSKRYENDIETDNRGIVIFLLVLIVSCIVFSWFYGIYILRSSVESTFEATLFGLALVLCMYGYAFWKSPTPASVEITQTSVIMELKRGRRVTIPFDKITWVSVSLDAQRIEDLSKATGSVTIGKIRALRTDYTIKRETALDIREAYRAYCGSYPPGGSGAAPKT